MKRFRGVVNRRRPDAVQRTLPGGGLCPTGPSGRGFNSAVSDKVKFFLVQHPETACVTYFMIYCQVMSYLEAKDRRELAPSLILPVGRLTPQDFDKIARNFDIKSGLTPITHPKFTIQIPGDGTLSVLAPHYRMEISDTWVAVSRKGFLAFVEATQAYGVDCNDVLIITKEGIHREMYPEENEMDVDVARARNWSVAEQVTKRHRQQVDGET